MKAFALLYSISAQSCTENIECVADPQCELGKSNPCFGGDCWNKLKILKYFRKNLKETFKICNKFDHLEWAEENCKEGWQSKFPDPGSPSSWIGYADFINSYPTNDDDDISKLPGCKQVFEKSWFGNESLDTCEFDIQLDTEEFPRSWITQFFDMSIKPGEASDGCKVKVQQNAQ